MLGAELRYKAWGETRYAWEGTPTTYRFTGQREDATIQLLFYNARFYDAALGRFIQADTMVPNPADPQSLNRYSYVRNNPLRFSDPSGHWYYDPGCQCLVQTRDSGHNYWIDPVSTRHHSGSRYLNYDETPESSPIKPIMPQDGGAAYCAVADCASADGIFDFLSTAAAIAFEPADWALTFNQWAHGDFHVLDLAGLLPFVSGQLDNVGDALHAANRAGVDEAANAGARHVPTWPNTAEEMDEFVGVEGRRIPDGPNTPGRNKVEWELSDDLTVTYEQHPYHPNALDWHRGPHWHLDTPRKRHERYLPGDPIPGYQ